MDHIQDMTIKASQIYDDAVKVSLSAEDATIKSIVDKMEKLTTRIYSCHDEIMSTALSIEYGNYFMRILSADKLIKNLMDDLKSLNHKLVEYIAEEETIIEMETAEETTEGGDTNEIEVSI
jgi:hypothetical protein